MEEACKCFKVIRKNIFLERKPNKIPSDTDWMICECKPPYRLPSGQQEGRYTVGCGLRCFNRLMSTECIEGLCRIDTCTNRRFQNQEHLQVYPVKTENRGWGLAAGQSIRKGQFVIQYMGEIYYIDSEVGRKRLEKYRASSSTYLMSIAQNEVIDPTKKGNEARFINHSCDPNCETQKWNVLGEVRIGIFAKRDIEEDEELTFDYRFDTLKTALARCLCGAANCKKYLGVIQMDLIVEPLPSGPCFHCKTIRENDSSTLICCEDCGHPFHLDCATPRAQSVEDSWCCSTCLSSRKTPVRQKHIRKRQKEAAKTIKTQQLLIAEMKSQDLDLPPDAPERKFTVGRAQMTVLRSHLDEILADGSRMLWTGEGDTVEVTLRDGDVQSTYELAMEYLKYETAQKEITEDNLGDISDVTIVVPTVYMRYILGPQDCHVSEYLHDHHVSIHYDTSVELDNLRSLAETTNMYVTGYKRSTESVVLQIYNIVDSLTLGTVYLHETACRLLEQSLGDLKRQMSPVDLRVGSVSEKYTASHPFYPYTRMYRKLVLIGKEEEVEAAEKAAYAQLAKLRYSCTEEEYILLVPTTVAEMLKRNSREIARSAFSLTDARSPLIKIPEMPISTCFLPIELNGTWEQVVKMKQRLEDELKVRLGPENFALFQRSVLPRIYSEMIKNTALYTHLMEKRYFYLTPQERKTWVNNAFAPEVLTHWDFLTCEVFSASCSNPVRRATIADILQDDECRVNLLRVAKDEAEIKLFLSVINVTPRQALETVLKWFKDYADRASNELPTVSYSSSMLDELASYYDFSEGSSPMSASKLMENEVFELRKVQQQSYYPILPIDYGFETKALLGMEHLPRDVQQYFSTLEDRALIPAEESEVEQRIELCPASSEVVANADVVVSCAQHKDNLLYVVYAGKAKKLKSFQDHYIS